jgi:hypothetical protein
MATKNNNDVVIIELDRPREIRFGHKALKTFQAITDTDIQTLGQDLTFDLIEKLAYCGMLSDARKNGETLTVEMVEDLLDEHDIQDTIEKVSLGLSLAFGGNEKNAPKKGKK